MTAKLAVAPELLVQALFQGARPDIEIRGASFDAVHKLVLLEIEGHDIPAFGEVVAIIHTQKLSIEFAPI